jgi:hypothetical protein
MSDTDFIIWARNKAKNAESVAEYTARRTAIILNGGSLSDLNEENNGITHGFIGKLYATTPYGIPTYSIPFTILYNYTNSGSGAISIPDGNSSHVVYIDGYLGYAFIIPDGLDWSITGSTLQYGMLYSSEPTGVRTSMLNGDMRIWQQALGLTYQACSDGIFTYDPSVNVFNFTVSSTQMGIFQSFLTVSIVNADGTTLASPWSYDIASSLSSTNSKRINMSLRYNGTLPFGPTYRFLVSLSTDTHLQTIPINIYTPQQDFIYTHYIGAGDPTHVDGNIINAAGAVDVIGIKNGNWPNCYAGDIIEIMVDISAADGSYLAYHQPTITCTQGEGVYATTVPNYAYYFTNGASTRIEKLTDVTTPDGYQTFNVNMVSPTNTHLDAIQVYVHNDDFSLSTNSSTIVVANAASLSTALTFLVWPTFPYRSTPLPSSAFTLTNVSTDFTFIYLTVAITDTTGNPHGDTTKLISIQSTTATPSGGKHDLVLRGTSTSGTHHWIHDITIPVTIYRDYDFSMSWSSAHSFSSTSTSATETTGAKNFYVGYSYTLGSILTYFGTSSNTVDTSWSVSIDDTNISCGAVFTTAEIHDITISVPNTVTPGNKHITCTVTSIITDATYEISHTHTFDIYIKVWGTNISITTDRNSTGVALSILKDTSATINYTISPLNADNFPHALLLTATSVASGASVNGVMHGTVALDLGYGGAGAYVYTPSIDYATDVTNAFSNLTTNPTTDISTGSVVLYVPPSATVGAATFSLNALTNDVTNTVGFNYRSTIVYYEVRGRDFTATPDATTINITAGQSISVLYTFAPTTVYDSVPTITSCAHTWTRTSPTSGAAADTTAPGVSNIGVLLSGKYQINIGTTAHDSYHGGTESYTFTASFNGVTTATAVTINILNYDFNLAYWSGSATGSNKVGNTTSRGIYAYPLTYAAFSPSNMVWTYTVIDTGGVTRSSAYSTSTYGLTAVITDSGVYSSFYGMSMDVTSSALTPLGTYTFTINAANSLFNHDINFTLTITARYDFSEETRTADNTSIYTLPGSITLYANSTYSYIIRTRRLYTDHAFAMWPRNDTTHIQINGDVNGKFFGSEDQDVTVTVSIPPTETSGNIFTYWVQMGPADSLVNAKLGTYTGGTFTNTASQTVNVPYLSFDARIGTSGAATSASGFATTGTPFTPYINTIPFTSAATSNVTWSAGGAGLFAVSLDMSHLPTTTNQVGTGYYVIVTKNTSIPGPYVFTLTATNQNNQSVTLTFNMLIT